MPRAHGALERPPLPRRKGRKLSRFALQSVTMWLRDTASLPLRQRGKDRMGESSSADAVARRFRTT